MKKFLTLIILFLIPSVFSLGISPSSIEYAFVPGGTYEGTACAWQGEGKNVSFKVDTVEGVVSEINFSNNNFIAQSDFDCINYTFRTKYFVKERGEVTQLLYLGENAEVPSGIVFDVRVAQRMIFDAHDAPVLEETVPKVSIAFVVLTGLTFLVGVALILFVRRKT
tara:strand:- start:2420 stop:2917 length:498 start_codon:yes stop_codon:yes gene_type:complete